MGRRRGDRWRGPQSLSEAKPVKRETSSGLRLFWRCALLAIATALAPTPAQADNPRTPPGNPCLRNNGNPCRGNNGNLGDQGNANHEKVKIDKKPPPISLGMPPVTDRGVFISQVGDG